MKRYLLLFILSSVGFSCLSATPVEYGISDIEYFNRRQYGGATQNWNISQAENGLLYFANNDGVMEYDGTRWRMFPPYPDLKNNPIRSVFADRGRIYVGATDEFGFYQADSTGNYSYHSLSDQYNIDKLGDYWNIFRYNSNLVFQSHNGLCIYTPDKSVGIVRAVSRISEAFKVNGMILAHDDTAGLMELRNGTLFKIPGGEIFSGKTIGAIMPLSKDEMIIGTIDYGLYRWDMNGIEKWDVPASDYLKKSNIFCGTSIGDHLAVGTIQAGVVMVDREGNIEMIAGKDKGLNNNTVLDVFIDHQGNIWAGLDNGIARISYNSAVSFIEGYFDLGTGYCMNKKGSDFYFGTNQALYTINENIFSSPTKDRSDFHMIKGTNGQVWSIFKDKVTNELLIGHNLGVFHIEGENATLISPPSFKGAWTFKYVPGRDDLLMVGTYTGLILLKRNLHNRWEFFRKIKGFVESSRFIEWDENGYLWVVHGLNGFYRLKFDNSYNRITEVKTKDDFKGVEDFDSFSLSQINDRLVFTSHNGIFTLSEEKDLVFRRDTLASYFSDGIFPAKLEQDRYGNIWFFVNNGVGVLRYQEDGTFKRIDNPLVPFKNKLVNGFESVYVLNDETAFFGIEDGFGQYSVTNDVNYYQPFDVHIRGFRSQQRDDELFYSSSKGEVQKYIPEFNFSENAFEVFFSATWFGSGELEYSTILEGYEQKWSPWGTIQTRQFTRLSEGNYTFKVKARNVHGVQSKAADFHFIVLPPLYRTTSAKILYLLMTVILFGTILWITYRIVEKSKQREELRQRKKYREREEELEREALENEKEMIRLRNEKLRNDMKHKEKELANSTMHIIRKNEFLIKIKDELQKIRKSGSQQVLEKKVGTVIRQIDRDIDNDAHWEIFETHLEQVHEDFFKRLTHQHRDLSAREMRLAAYLRMNMSSKEIASLMNITPRAVENNRYKLRKKLGLEQGDNLVDYIMKV